MQAAIAWITTNVPEDANGYVLVYKWQADSTQTARTFSTSPNQCLVAALTAVEQTVGP